jgi:TPR repeat protein
MNKLLLTFLIILFSLTSNVVWSADFQKGLEAAQRGDFATSLREWKPLGEQGHASAQYNLGVMYDKGDGVVQDYKTAVKWYTLAAEQGHADAQYNLGQMYRRGDGVPQDYKTALKWYTLAAEQGDADAQNNLGVMYDNGDGVPQDDKTAVKWYTLAAEQGHASAQNHLGVMYNNGEGVPQDYETAVKWYTLAAEQDNAYAQYNLALMYDNGDGVPQDDKTAVKWYKKAAEQGDVDAQQALDRIIGVTKKKPANSFITSDGWKCKTGYTKRGNFCRENIENGYWTYDGSTMKCFAGYEKSGNGCIKKITIPANAHSSGGGWTCNTNYYKNTNTSCLRVPANASSSYDSNYWKCKSGYRRVGKGCESTLRTIYIDGNKYVGELRNGKPHGKGTYTYSSSGQRAGYKYVGEFKNGLRNGQGVFTFPGGNKYVGEFKNGKFNGQGTYSFSNGGKYVGEFRDNLYNGQGVFTYPDGDKYVGEFKNDKYNGQGTYTFSPSGQWAGDKYVGEFKDNNYNGQGVYTYADGGKYIGEWKDDKKHGQGTYTYANGTTKEGVWKDNEFQYAKNESTPKNNYSNDEELLPASSGTGFAVTSDGYVVTNNHVVQDCNNVEIYHKGRAIPAIVVNVDPIIDLAIIKGNFRPEKFYFLSTKRPRLRMSVDVVGYGFGKKISSNVKVTRGIISSLVGIQNDSSRFQIDAAVQPGNSGGPIIDKIGNVIGVAVEKVHPDWAKENLSRLPENIAFGIKSGAVINFLDGNNIKYSIDNELSDDEIDTLIHSGTYYLSCLMTLSQYEKVKKNRVLFSDLN